MPVRDLMSLIAKTGRRKFLVTDNHALLGVITLADLTAYLNLSELLGHSQKATPTS
jgi:CBS domain-containing protein